MRLKFTILLSQFLRLNTMKKDALDTNAKGMCGDI